MLVVVSVDFAEQLFELMFAVESIWVDLSDRSLEHMEVDGRLCIILQYFAVVEQHHRERNRYAKGNQYRKTKEDHANELVPCARAVNRVVIHVPALAEV